MNWLAHAFLSPPVARVCLGNLLADAIEPRSLPSLGDEFLRGVALHRAIDAAVHSHPAAGRARRSLSGMRLRFTGVVTDIVWDHFLLKRWTEFSDESLDDFIGRVYGYETKMPAELSGDPPSLMRAIVRYDLLRSYASLDGVRDALERLARRVESYSGRRLPLADAMPDVRENYDFLETCFAEIFPDMIAVAGNGGQILFATAR